MSNKNIVFLIINIEYISLAYVKRFAHTFFEVTFNETKQSSNLD